MIFGYWFGRSFFYEILYRNCIIPCKERVYGDVEDEDNVAGNTYDEELPPFWYALGGEQ